MYVVAQVAGACVGVIVANVMFDLPAVTLSTHDRSSAGVLARGGRRDLRAAARDPRSARTDRSSFVPFAVGGYIAAAYWFTSSTSFANPAVTIARSLTDTFAGISPSSVPAFVVAQLVGGARRDRVLAR